MNVVNERTTSYLTTSFRDKAGAAAAPTAVTYRIDCLTTGVQIRPWTAVDPAASVEITLTADDNAIVSEPNARERRRVTVIASYGAGESDQLTDEHDYEVRNLKFVG